MGTKYQVTNEGVVVPLNASSAPTGVTGGLYFNTSTGKMKVYNGASWVDMS